MDLPPDFIAQLEALLPNEASALVAALDTPASVSLHQNPRKPYALPWPALPVPWYAGGLYLEERPSFTLDPAFHAGAYYVQEASSMLVAAAFERCFPDARPLRVLDLCAAPGGKSTLLASVLPEGSWLLANEVIRSRYQVLRYNVSKWGFPNVFTSNHDVADFGGLAGFFDLVLVDAPCSGEGLFRKDEAARGEWSPEHVQFCAARQGRILADAVKLVAPGGVLLYSTCTYNRTENDGNAQWLAQQLGMAHVPLTLPEAWGLEQRPYGHQAYPHRLVGEGFYLAAFRRDGERPTGEARKIPPFKKLQTVNSKLAPLAQPWEADGVDNLYFTSANNTNWRALEAGLLDDARWLSAHLSNLEVGTILGEQKGKEIVPAPEWALHVHCSKDLPAVDTDLPTALEWLRKNTPELDLHARGWHIVRYQGLHLGWIKALGNRYNNYYPSHWRIRMGGG
jgi:16S rRNA C967 or C1407 C5-methylase (RsmB/RsmF family)/NOL1/NOP2/fmu family ribosome biogenesis protein